MPSVILNACLQTMAGTQPVCQQTPRHLPGKPSVILDGRSLLCMARWSYLVTNGVALLQVQDC